MEITFGGVCGLRVVDYGLQNVVSRLLSSSLANLTHADIVLHVTWIHATREGVCLVSTTAIEVLVEKNKKNEILLFILEPSWGAELSILVDNFTIRRL